MSISKNDIIHIAKLAKLKLDDEEATIFAREFENILKQFKTLDKLDLDGVTMEKPNVSVLRKDVQKKCEIEDLYINTKVMRETSIEVPKIIE